MRQVQSKSAALTVDYSLNYEGNNNYGYQVMHIYAHIPDVDVSLDISNTENEQIIKLANSLVENDIEVLQYERAHYEYSSGGDNE